MSLSSDYYHRVYSCGRKLAHVNYLQALYHASRVQKLGPDPLLAVNVYPCRHCGTMHVGRDRKRTRRMNQLQALLRDPLFLAKAHPGIQREKRMEYWTLVEEYC